MTDDTTIRQNNDVLQAIADLSKQMNKRIDDLELNVNAKFSAVDKQFEPIREGIVHNASRFDRLEANVFNVRSDISNLKADLRDLTEEIRRNQKSFSLK